MQFDDDFGVPFSGIVQPWSSGLEQPRMSPTSMFSGTIPGVQFAPVEALHPGKVNPLHGPEFRPIYEPHPVHPHTQFARAHPVLGHRLDTWA